MKRHMEQAGGPQKKYKVKVKVRENVNIDYA